MWFLEVSAAPCCLQTRNFEAQTVSVNDFYTSVNFDTVIGLGIPGNSVEFNLAGPGGLYTDYNDRLFAERILNILAGFLPGADVTKKYGSSAFSATAQAAAGMHAPKTISCAGKSDIENQIQHGYDPGSQSEKHQNKRRSKQFGYQHDKPCNEPEQSRIGHKI